MVKRTNCNNPNCDYVCFTDNPNLKSEHWNIVHLTDSLPPHLMARKLIINSHIMTEGYDASLSVGGQIKINSSIDFSILDTCDMALRKHPYRNCVFAEGLFVINNKKEDITKVYNQMLDYRFAKMPYNYGLWETGVIYRKNNSEISRFEKIWWAENNKYSYRDQLSLPLVIWNIGHWKEKLLKIKALPTTIMNCLLNSPNDRTKPFIIYEHGSKDYSSSTPL